MESTNPADAEIREILSHPATVAVVGCSDNPARDSLRILSAGSLRMRKRLVQRVGTENRYGHSGQHHEDDLGGPNRGTYSTGGRWLGLHRFNGTRCI